MIALRRHNPGAGERSREKPQSDLKGADERYLKTSGGEFRFPIRCHDLPKQVKLDGVVSRREECDAQKRLRLPDPLQVDWPIQMLNPDTHIAVPGDDAVISQNE